MSDKYNDAVERIFRELKASFDKQKLGWSHYQGVEMINAIQEAYNIATDAQNLEIERLKAELAKVPVMDFDAAIKALKEIIKLQTLIPAPENLDYFGNLLRNDIIRIAELAHRAIGSMPKIFLDAANKIETLKTEIERLKEKLEAATDNLNIAYLKGRKDMRSEIPVMDFDAAIKALKSIIKLDSVREKNGSFSEQFCQLFDTTVLSAHKALGKEIKNENGN